MKTAAVICSVTGLALTVIPSFLVFYGVIAWRTHANLMFAGMALWFVFAPSVIRRGKGELG